MPFTFSHPGFVLPLKRFRLFSLSGLIAGSLIPDIDHYIRIKSQRTYAHTWGALFSYDIVFAILLLYIFHNVVRNPLIDNSPQWLFARINKYKFFLWNPFFKKKWTAVVFSILIGGITHLLLDNIAHENGEVAIEIPGLLKTYYFSGIRVEGWMVIQLLTSLIGFIIVVYTIWKLPHSKNEKSYNASANYWKIVIAVTFIFFLRGLIYRATHRMEDYIIPPVSGFLLGIALAPLAYRFKKNKTRRAKKKIYFQKPHV